MTWNLHGKIVSEYGDITANHYGMTTNKLNEMEKNYIESCPHPKPPTYTNNLTWRDISYQLATPIIDQEETDSDSSDILHLPGPSNDSRYVTDEFYTSRDEGRSAFRHYLSGEDNHEREYIDNPITYLPDQLIPETSRNRQQTQTLVQNYPLTTTTEAERG
jgi:hypothetical protein